VLWALRDTIIKGFYSEPGVKKAFVDMVADCRAVLRGRKESVLSRIRAERDAEARHLRIVLLSVPLYAFLLRLRLSRPGRVLAAAMRG
jgi:hypothetical protein